MNSKLVVVTGPTATGKTAFAAHLANHLNGEIISADSRQVYKGMDLGTGKDYDDYNVSDKKIPYHLIDIKEPGYEYNVFEFQKDFLEAYDNIIQREKMPILCGGTGMYIEAVLKGYKLIKVPKNTELREKLESCTEKELISLLSSFKALHNVTDSKDRHRVIKAIEIQEYYKNNPKLDLSFPTFNHIIFGVHFNREEIRQRITTRLKTRMNEGMTDEVKGLLDSGLKPEQLKFYGLEYKFLTQYVEGEISKDELFILLNTAIHQFAKRQMTWFRRMERQGIKINWIDGNLSMNNKIELSLSIINQQGNN